MKVGRQKTYIATAMITINIGITRPTHTPMTTFLWDPPVLLLLYGTILVNDARGMYDTGVPVEELNVLTLIPKGIVVSTMF